jgi:hypothetical protein
VLAAAADAQIMPHTRESRPGARLPGRRTPTVAVPVEAPRARRLRMTYAVLLVANLVALAVFQALRGGSGYDSLYGWVANFTMLVPTVACFALARLGGPRRAAAIWLGLAMLSQTAGNVLVSLWLQFEGGAAPPPPPPRLRRPTSCRPYRPASPAFRRRPSPASPRRSPRW